MLLLFGHCTFDRSKKKQNVLLNFWFKNKIKTGGVTTHRLLIGMTTIKSRHSTDRVMTSWLATISNSGTCYYSTWLGNVVLLFWKQLSEFSHALNIRIIMLKQHANKYARENPSSAALHPSRCSLHCRYSWPRLIDFGKDSWYFKVL